MELVKTKSFEIAIITAGSKKASKMAIIMPGRLDTKDYAQNLSHMAFLAGKGYFAISFDPPGTWDSPGEIGLYNTTNYIKAVNELIEYFGNKPTVLMGHSRGGTIAMLVGAHNPLVSHIISVNSQNGGVTTFDIPEKGKTLSSYRDLPPGRTRSKEKKRFDLPYSYFEDSDTYDAMEDLKKSTKPKLFFYSTKDEIVAPGVVRRMFDNSAKPKFIHELHSEHDYRLYPEIIDEVNLTVDSFLANNSSEINHNLI